MSFSCQTQYSLLFLEWLFLHGCFYYKSKHWGVLEPRKPPKYAPVTIYLLKNSHSSCKKKGCGPVWQPYTRRPGQKSCEIQVETKKWLWWSVYGKNFNNNNLGLIPASLGINTKFTWIVFFAIDRPSQPFHGCHLDFTTFSPWPFCVGLPDWAVPFFYTLDDCFWVDFTSFCNLTFLHYFRERKWWFMSVFLRWSICWRKMSCGPRNLGRATGQCVFYRSKENAVFTHL